MSIKANQKTTKTIPSYEPTGLGSKKVDVPAFFVRSAKVSIWFFVFIVFFAFFETDIAFMILKIGGGIIMAYNFLLFREYRRGKNDYIRQDTPKPYTKRMAKIVYINTLMLFSLFAVMWAGSFQGTEYYIISSISAFLAMPLFFSQAWLYYAYYKVPAKYRRWHAEGKIEKIKKDQSRARSNSNHSEHTTSSFSHHKSSHYDASSSLADMNNPLSPSSPLHRHS